jgi:hypothetical protein
MSLLPHPDSSSRPHNRHTTIYSTVPGCSCRPSSKEIYNHSVTSILKLMLSHCSFSCRLAHIHTKKRARQSNRDRQPNAVTTRVRYLGAIRRPFVATAGTGTARIDRNKTKKPPLALWSSRLAVEFFHAVEGRAEGQHCQHTRGWAQETRHTQQQTARNQTCG